MSKNTSIVNVNEDVLSLVRNAYLGINLCNGSNETILLKDIEQRLNGYIHQDATRETVKNKRFCSITKSSKVADLLTETRRMSSNSDESIKISDIYGQNNENNGNNEDNEDNEDNDDNDCESDNCVTPSLISLVDETNVSKKIVDHVGNEMRSRKVYIKDDVATVDDVLSLMITEKMKCNYCKITMHALKEDKRDPLMWTLDRIDNSLRHTRENTVLSCLKCNLKRGKREKTLFTESLRTTKIIKQNT